MNNKNGLEDRLLGEGMVGHGRTKITFQFVTILGETRRKRKRESGKF